MRRVRGDACYTVCFVKALRDISGEADVSPVSGCRCCAGLPTKREMHDDLSRYTHTYYYLLSLMFILIFKIQMVDQDQATSAEGLHLEEKPTY